jgi:AcrR family transcriptional regulator
MCHTGSMPAATSPLRSARDRARTEITAEILSTARRHLAVDGAAGLSLRAVARELGLVSSAVYRYFENRDALLTALIVEAYDSLGDATEAAVAASAGRPPLERWVDAADTIRTWALEHLQEYTLLYGSPVPGYQAPDDTVVPGTRVSLALVSIVVDAHAQGLVHPPPIGHGPVGDQLRADLTALAALIAPGVEEATVISTVLGWTQLFGLLGFELFGQTRGLVSDHRAMFVTAAHQMGAVIGLG